jgi:hypothetical protein
MKGYPDSENTWEPAENFDDMTIVTKYWKNIEGVEEKRPKKKRTEKSNSITYLLTAFMFLLVFNPIFAIKVRKTGHAIMK